MKLQIITLILCVIALGITQQANAETFILEATSEQNKFDYLYIEFFWDGDTILTKDAFLKLANYEDPIIFDGTPAKFYNSQGFSMKARDAGIMVFGHPVSTLANLEYTLTVIIKGENGREKLKFHSHGIPEEYQAPIVEEILRDPLAEYEAAQILTGPALVSELERIAEEERLAALSVEEEQYIPELLITSSHDFTTYWNDVFNIDVQTFDGNINSDPKSSSDFEGRIDGVDIKVFLTNDDETITLSGTTKDNGHWAGEWYFPANISAPGEYIVDIVTSYLGESVSKSSSMFIINTVIDSGDTNYPPIAIAGDDQTVEDLVPNPDFDDRIEKSDDNPEYILNTILLNGSDSSDPNNDELTYSWTQITDRVIANSTNIDVKLDYPTDSVVTFMALPNPYNELDENACENPSEEIEEICENPYGELEAIFELTVTDPKGSSSVDTVIITIVQINTTDID